VRPDQPINQSTSQLIRYADNSLLLGHRNSEWCGHGPVLEQDIAITNISLDLIGQARNFYQYAADLINSENSSTEATEDSLAYRRDAAAFRNFLLLELPKEDWAHTVLRQFFFSSYQYLLFEQLQASTDEQVAAIAAKSLKEVTYHRRWSSEWVIRLGDGTDESHRRIKEAIQNWWGYTGEFFLPENNEGINIAALQANWLRYVEEIFAEATLSVPDASSMNKNVQTGHTPHLEELLNEMQHLQRTYPDATW